LDSVLIKGCYEPLGSACDGDSIRFRADDPALWRLVYPAVRAPSRSAQLRLEAIDAPETHYAAGGRMYRQHPALARAAAGELLAWLGFETVHRRADETVLSCGPREARGYVLTRFADRYGRCVALVFRGAIDAADGSALPVDEDVCRESANFHLLATGFAYPTFYSMLPVPVREAFGDAAASARSRQLGLWPADATQRGVVPALLGAQTDAAGNDVVLPKLFRRLADWMATAEGAVGTTGLREFVAARPERVTLPLRGQTTTFDRLLDIADGRIALATAPEELVFHERL